MQCILFGFNTSTSKCSHCLWLHQIPSQHIYRRTVYKSTAVHICTNTRTHTHVRLHAQIQARKRAWRVGKVNFSNGMNKEVCLIMRTSTWKSNNKPNASYHHYHRLQIILSFLANKQNTCISLQNPRKKAKKGSEKEKAIGGKRGDPLKNCMYARQIPKLPTEMC